MKIDSCWRYSVFMMMSLNCIIQDYILIFLTIKTCLWTKFITFSHGCFIFMFYTTVVNIALLNVINQFSMTILTLIKLEIEFKLDLLGSFVFREVDFSGASLDSFILKFWNLNPSLMLGGVWQILNWNKIICYVHLRIGTCNKKFFILHESVWYSFNS
jgi:hypothetical protein